MEWECNCARCNGEGPDYDEHETCECYDCHEAGYHEEPDQWASDCEWCDQMLVERALENEEEDQDGTNIREISKETLEDHKETL